MEQKEVIHRYYMVGTATLGKVLQMLNHLSMEGLIKLKDSRMPLKGETNLYKLMNRSDPLTSASLNEKVDLSVLKEALLEQGLPFAFQSTKSGTTLYFRVKDKELAKNGLDNVLRRIKETPKRYLKKPGTMTFDEKVAYAKGRKEYQGVITPQPDLSKGRGVS